MTDDDDDADLLREIRDLLRESAEREKHLIGLSLAAGGLPPDPGAEVPPDEPDQIGTVEWWVEDESLAPNVISPAYLRQVLRHYLTLRAEAGGRIDTLRADLGATFSRNLELNQEIATLRDEVDRLAHAVETFRKADPDHAEWPNVPAWAQRGIESLRREVGRLTRERDEASRLADNVADRAARYREALEAFPLRGSDEAWNDWRDRVSTWALSQRSAALAAAPPEEAPGE